MGGNPVGNGGCEILIQLMSNTTLAKKKSIDAYKCAVFLVIQYFLN